MSQNQATLSGHATPVPLASDTTTVFVEEKPWGELPLFSLISAVGLMLIAVADNISRRGAGSADWLFWPAVIVLYVPISYRLIFTRASRQERLGLVVLAALSFYAVKVLHSPTHFTFFDEFLHWRTTLDIMQSHRLFAENSLLPVSSLYPGLEIVTSAFANLSGISIFQSGIIVIGISRVVLVLSLFLLMERVTKSSRMASIAVLIYMANSNFVFFDGQFAYESLALPLAAFILFATVSRQESAHHKRDLLILIAVGIIALAITHHLTLYLLTTFLVLWTVWAFLRNPDRKQAWQLSIVAVVALIASIGWSQFVGNVSADYLIPVFQNGISDFIGIITNEMASRQLFTSAAGLATPFWEQMIGWASVAFILIAVPFGLYQVWKRSRRSGLALALASIVLAYPVSLGFRLTAHGWEISNRTSEFLFIGLGFVLAMAVAWLLRSRFVNTQTRIATTIWIAVIFMGGIIVGWPWWAAQPGPYMVSADTRSIDSEGITAAEWSQTNLGPNNRVGTDRINRVLDATYGDQNPVTVLEDKLDVSPLFYAPTLDSEGRQIISALNLHYLVVDQRLSTALPAIGTYFEVDSPTTPIPAASLNKFDGMAGVNRVYDSGNIAIYDVSKLK